MTSNEICNSFAAYLESAVYDLAEELSNKEDDMSNHSAECLANKLSDILIECLDTTGRKEFAQIFCDNGAEP